MLEQLRNHYRSGSLFCAMLCSGSKKFGTVDPLQLIINYPIITISLSCDSSGFGRVDQCMFRTGSRRLKHLKRISNYLMIVISSETLQFEEVWRA